MTFLLPRDGRFLSVRAGAVGPLAIALLAGVAVAWPRLPIPATALDGGFVSAETIGRGGTIASNHSSPASGSENPAALDNDILASAYATALVHTSSSLGKDFVDAQEPLTGQVLRYLSMGAEKGVVYYEPLGRLRQRQYDVLGSSDNYTDVNFAANAIGFAGANALGLGSIGVSIAYLWGSAATDQHRLTRQSADEVSLDNLNGLRMNIGLRYPTGPAMWGLVLQNAPGFLWGSDHRREQLPLSIRAGSTYRLAPGFLISIDGERRYYNEGSDPQTVYYVGDESTLSSFLTVRVGLYGPHLDQSDERHWTAGLSLTGKTGLALSYAIDNYHLLDEKVNRHTVSLQAPFQTEKADKGHQ